MGRPMGGGGRLRTWLASAAALVAGLLALAALLLFLVSETQAGRDWVTTRLLPRITLQSGLGLEADRIEGSLLRHPVIKGARLRDLDGVFMTAPRIEIDFRTRGFLQGAIRLTRLEVPEASLLRLPRLNPTPPDEPILPDIELAIDRFRLERLTVDEKVAGVREVLGVSGRIDLGGGQLLTDLDISGERGDRLLLLAEAAPDRDRLDLRLNLETTADGLFAGLLGIDRPLSARLEGEGGWSRWRGGLAIASGSDPLATLALSADDGRFGLSGQLMPGPFLDGTAAAIAGPRVALEATAGPGKARATTAFTLALAGAGGIVEARGDIDRQRERLVATTVAATLADPGLVDPRLSGAPLLVEAALEGPWRQPALSLRASSAALAFADDGGSAIGLGGIEAAAELVWVEARDATAARRARLPFELRATGISGIEDPLESLLGAPRLSGELLLGADRIEANGLVLVAAGLSATGKGFRERVTGRYGLAADVRAPNLAVTGVGRGDVRIGLRIATGPRGAVAASGTASIDVRGLDNASLGDFLGGNPVLRLPFAWDAGSGRLIVTDGTLSSPAVALKPITGTLDPGTRTFDLRAGGRLARYGPIDAKAAGSLSRPRATIRMAEPGLGIGLSNLVAEIVPEGQGFRLRAAGETPEGAARLDGVIELAPGRPLAIRVEQSELAGLSAVGRLEQQPSGTFAGRFLVEGPGVEGSLSFLDSEGRQRVDLEGVAAQARLPLAVPIRIGAGDVRASILFLPEGPRIEGEARGRNIRRGALELAEFAAEGESRGAGAEGRIRLAGSADGRPLRLAATVSATGAGYAVGIKGTIDGLDFQLARPATLRRVGGGFELLPARLTVAGGTIDLSGRLADTRGLRLKAAGVDVQFLRLVGLGPGLRGRIDADIDLALGAGDAFPSGRARVRIADFAAQTLLEGTPEVSLDAEIVTTAAGLDAGIAIRGTRGTSGRMRVLLAPGPGDTLAERALAGRLSGGIRYTGPAETVWSLLNVPDQSLVGPIGLVADFGGTLGLPQLSGGFRGEQLSYRHLAFGTRITGLTLQGVLEGNELRLVSLEGKVNGGTIRGRGAARLAAEGADDVDLQFTLQRARIASSPSTTITVTGPLRLKGSLSEQTLSGELRVDEGQIRLGGLQPAAVTSDIQVRRVDAPLPAAVGSSTRIGFDIRVSARDSVTVKGLGLDSFWSADVRIGGNVAQPRLNGDARLTRGSFDFAGTSFDIRRGIVGFVGQPLDTSLAIEAVATAEGMTALVRIDGTAGRPELSFSSSPPLPEDEVLSRLLFGSSVSDLSATEALQLATALASLRGGTGGLDPLGRLQRASGIDRIRLTGSDSETGMGTGIAFGERIGRNLYVEVATDTRGNALTRVELTLTRVLSLLAQVTTLGDAGINLRYAREY